MKINNLYKPRIINVLDIDAGTDEFGIKATCSYKYSNCQLCKYREEPQDCKACTHCLKHNKKNEYYRY